MTAQSASARARGGPRNSEPCAVVIFGASGDLTQRKLVPALYNAFVDGLLPANFAIVGAVRSPVREAEFAQRLQAGTEQHSRRPVDPPRWAELAARISTVEASPDDPQGYARLAQHLAQVDARHGTAGNRLYYLATPPSAFSVIATRLGESGLNRPGAGGTFCRLVVEKPSGQDLASARALNTTLNAHFAESDVFRIDHYLGKETVQNLLVFRFANAIFEPLWSHKYVDSVQLTVSESLGVEGRGAYYEEAGTTRDMVQNHMFQLLCLLAMEPPVSLTADAIRDEKVKVLQALRPLPAERVRECTVRGQYAEGVVSGQKVAAYLAEPGVAADSRTETYVALRMHIDNWRWARVPFYLRAGKRLGKRLTEISLRFHDVPHRLFPQELEPNALTLRIQPDEGIDLRFDAKAPGAQSRIQPVTMNFHYEGSFGREPPEAYERLLVDAMHGDGTLFIRRDEVEAAWSFVDQLYEGWSLEDPASRLPQYTSGTWGPAESDVMVARDGRTWRRY